MNGKSRSAKGYAVYEESPLSCREYSLSLEEAFYSILAHCRYEAVWETEETQLSLRFRYMEGEAAGQFIGATEPGPEIKEFSEDLYDKYGVTRPLFHIRDLLMKRTLSAGLRGWYGVPMDNFYMEHSKAEGERRQQLGAVK